MSGLPPVHTGIANVLVSLSQSDIVQSDNAGLWLVVQHQLWKVSTQFHFSTGSFLLLLFLNTFLFTIFQRFQTRFFNVFVYVFEIVWPNKQALIMTVGHCERQGGWRLQTENRRFWSNKFLTSLHHSALADQNRCPNFGFLTLILVFWEGNSLEKVQRLLPWILFSKRSQNVE